MDDWVLVEAPETTPPPPQGAPPQLSFFAKLKLAMTRKKKPSAPLPPVVIVATNEDRWCRFDDANRTIISVMLFALCRRDFLPFEELLARSE